MLSRGAAAAVGCGWSRALASGAAGQGAGHHESLGERVKHVAEEAVHKAESVVEGVKHYVHEHRERAHEEAERGMFTADDIQEAVLMARGVSAPQLPGVSAPLQGAGQGASAAAGVGVPTPEHEDADTSDMAEATDEFPGARAGEGPGSGGPAVYHPPRKPSTPRTYEASEEEVVLEELSESQDFGSAPRQREMQGLRRAVAEEEGEEVRRG